MVQGTCGGMAMCMLRLSEYIEKENRAINLGGGGISIFEICLNYSQ